VVCGTATVETVERKASTGCVRIDISGSPLIGIPKVLGSVVTLRRVGGIEVVDDRAVIQPVQWDSVGLLSGEDVAGCSFVGKPEIGDRILQLCAVGGVEVVCTSSTVCPEQGNDVPAISTSLERSSASLWKVNRLKRTRDLKNINGRPPKDSQQQNQRCQP
jgi:hypothetical protein